jgi:hypothetical protein
LDGGDSASRGGASSGENGGRAYGVDGTPCWVFFLIEQLHTEVEHVRYHQIEAITVARDGKGL